MPPPGVEPGHVTHPSTNRARCRVTSLIRPTPITTMPRRHLYNSNTKAYKNFNTVLLTGIFGILCPTGRFATFKTGIAVGPAPYVTTSLCQPHSDTSFSIPNLPISASMTSFDSPIRSSIAISRFHSRLKLKPICFTKALPSFFLPRTDLTILTPKTQFTNSFFLS